MNREPRRFTFSRLNVTFDLNIKVLNMRTYEYVHRTARISHWQRTVADRIRFSKRIMDVENVISPILSSEHRLKMMGESIEMTQFFTSAKQPDFPEFAIETMRLQTFDIWPKFMKQRPKELSDAGFFYTKRGAK